MKITCPECDTSYTIPDGAIPPEGKKVKCAKCANLWLQKPEEEENPSEEAPETPEDDAESTQTTDKEASAIKEAIEEAKKDDPVEDAFPMPEDDFDSDSTESEGNIKKVGTPIYAGFAVLLMIAILMAILSMPHGVSALSGFYDAIGMKKTDRLGFSEFSGEKFRVGNKLEFAFKGTILNNSNGPREVPNVVIRALSKGGNIMGEVHMEPNIRTLKPGQTVAIAPELTGVSGNTHSLVIDIGNGWEKAFRD